jgi:predicted RNA-binding protein
MLIVEVQDDGVGRVKAMEMKSKSATTRKSLGLKITTDRLKMLHSNSNAEGVIEYIDLYDSNKEANGTIVRIKIPVDLDN